MRIVSLIASSTEIVYELGYGDCLVGRSHECDFPASVQKLPSCTEPKFNTNGLSYEIDQRVKAIMQESLSVYRVHADKLKELRPDVIITQVQCEVCAVSLKDVKQVVSDFLENQPKIVSLEPNSLLDIWNDFSLVADALGDTEKGKALVCRLKEKMKDISQKAQAIRVKPTVACIEWIDPLMAAGHWIPELVTLAGGINLFGEAGKPAPWMTWEELVKKDPDVIVIMPCGFDIQKIEQEMPLLTCKSYWDQLKAVQNHNVYLTDGNQYFNRPGPRLLESLEILSEIFHPDVFHFRHENKGWKNNQRTE